MAESSGTEKKKYGKILQRSFSRTVERMRSTLGRTDKTRDEEFERLLGLFKEQQPNMDGWDEKDPMHSMACWPNMHAETCQAFADSLMKGISGYTRQESENKVGELYLAIKNSYEPDWYHSENFKEMACNVSKRHDTHYSFLNDEVYLKGWEYASQFPKMQEKIAKRGRKLIDYDAARRKVRTLEGAKKRHETKIAEAYDELGKKKRIYEQIHLELLRELPALFDSRVLSLCSLFEHLLKTEQEMYEELYKNKKGMHEIVSKMREKAAEEAEEKAISRATATANLNEVEESRSYTVGGKAIGSNGSGDTTQYAVEYSEIGSTGTAPGRPALNAVGSKTEAGKDADVRDVPESPAVVQQRMMAKKRQEEELLKQQMLKQRQKEEFLKQEQKKQPVRPEQDEARRKEEIMQQQQQRQQQRQQQILELSNKPKVQTSVVVQTSPTTPTATQSATVTTQSVVTSTQPPKESSVSTTSNSIKTETTTIEKSLFSSASISSDTKTFPASSPVVNSKSENTDNKTESSVGVSQNVSGNSDTTSSSKLEPVSVIVEDEKSADDAKKKVSFEGATSPVTNSQQEQEERKLDSSTDDIKVEYPVIKPSLFEQATIALQNGKKDEDVILYSVKVNNEYSGEDNEELTLEPGQVIKVLERRPNQEPLDEGWLFGINTATGVRGMFPANFTSKLET